MEIELKKYNITPIVTLYDNDLPEPLQLRGGWLNDDTNDHFVEYARKCFAEFGNDVTITEDSCQVEGYFAAALMDSFEWVHGFSVKYGLHHVDFTDTDRVKV
ncbi:beta-glucosidase A [Patella vulgata]|uniref:beta-glucosidase A n=1 Tax=Patella vulgata TaxID=6465 RepID=UPI0021805B97|nr:beta-glucosidase A [Patella vulgata]